MSMLKGVLQGADLTATIGLFRLLFVNIKLDAINQADLTIATGCFPFTFHQQGKNKLLTPKSAVYVLLYTEVCFTCRCGSSKTGLATVTGFYPFAFHQD